MPSLGAPRTDFDDFLQGTTTMFSDWIAIFLQMLAEPLVGLAAVFAAAFLSATLLPMGSEPVVFAFIHLHPELFWLTMLAATGGNTLGGALSWVMGRGTHALMSQSQKYLSATTPPHPRALRWLERFGAKACLLSWLPVVGDPLCAVAGWLKLPFWPCLMYMALGKFARYLSITGALLWIWPKASL